MMRRFIDRIILSVMRHAWAVIIVTALLTVVSLFALPKLEFDGSYDKMFDHRSADYTGFDEWKAQFGSDEMAFVVLSDKDIFTQENIRLIRRLTERFEKIRHVSKVTSLTTVNDIVGSENDFVVERLVENIPESTEKLQKLRQRALANPLFVKNVISRDGRTAAILVELDNLPDSDMDARDHVVGQIRQIADEETPAGREIFVSGSLPTRCAYSGYMKKDMGVFVPIALIMIVVVLVVVFRNTAAVILSVLVVGISLIWSFALLYVLGFKITNITTIIPPMILSVAVAYSIHYVADIIRMGNARSEAAVFKVTSEVFWPSFMCCATTVAGFISLSNNIQAITEMGIISAAATFFAFVVTFTLLPALIKAVPFVALRLEKAPRVANTDEGRSMFFAQLAMFNDKHKKRILLVAAVIVIVSFWGATRLRVESSLMEQFRKDSPIYIATKHVEDNICGIQLVNITLRAGAEDTFKNPEDLEAIEEIKTYLNTIPQVDKVMSLLDYIKEMNKAFHNEDHAFYRMPDSRQMVAQYVLLFGANDLEDYVNSAWNWTTVSVRLKEHSTAKNEVILNDIRNFVQGRFGGRYATSVVGPTVLEVGICQNLTRGQIQSLVMGFLAIFGMMFLDLRSFGLGCLSLAPNMFPLLLNFGIMGFLNISLDTATVLISNVAIGVIIDDTIHLLHTFGERLEMEGGDYTKTMCHVLEHKGRPIVYASVVLVVGFGVIMFSGFVPVFNFGLLTALLMFNAIIAELFLTPSLLLLLKPRFPKSLRGNREKETQK